MSQGFSQEWFNQVTQHHGREATRGEDLRYDDGFIQLRTHNASMFPDPQWMITKASELLLKSADLRVCIYGLHATAMAGDIESFIRILRFYAVLFDSKYEYTYPEGEPQKIATFEWCTQSLMHKQFEENKVEPSREEKKQIKEILDYLHATIEQKAGEPLRWHSMEQWVDTEPESEPEPVKPEKRAEEPQIINDSRDSKPVLEQIIKAYIKENQYEKAISLSRAHRYSSLTLPNHQNNRVTFEIHQSTLEKLRVLYEKQAWTDLFREVELYFLMANSQFYFKLNFWSYQALENLGQYEASELIVYYLKKLYKSYRQLFSLMYNGGQLFCDSETLTWVERLCDESVVTNTAPQADYLQYLKEQDVKKMMNWLQVNPIVTIKDCFVRDLLSLKIAKASHKDMSLSSPLSSLVERSLKEKVYDWEPDLAKFIWQYYARNLNDEKPKQTNVQAYSAWQSQWDEFTHRISKVHLPTALEIMEHV